MNASTSLITYDRISKERSWLCFAVSPVFLTVGCGLLSIGHIGWQITGGMLFVLGVLLLVRIRTTFDQCRRVFREEHRLLACFPVWQRTFHIDQFDAVLIERRESCHPGSPRAENESYDISYRIGLRRRTGQPFWLRDDSFSSGESCRRAEEFAHQLSCDTGLEIIGVEV